jgi:myo-inositol catabolism protein IolC
MAGLRAPPAGAVLGAFAILRRMPLGYDQKLYILAFDHRGSFQKKFFGIQGEPDAEQTAIIADAKHLIFEGMLRATASGTDPSVTGVLVDEQFGSTVPQEARERGLKLAMPAERSGQEMFDFQYGDDFGEHILRFDPDFTKVLVRYNPDGDAAGNNEQLGKLKRLSDWLKQHDRKFLFELLVPAEPAQLEEVGGDSDRYDAELRPELMRRAIAEIQDAGIEVDIWKIEGVDARSDDEMLVAQARTGGRDGVVCVVLGRGADDDKVDHWLEQAAPVDGFVGFAIGRSIWWDPLKAYVDGKIERSEGARRIAENYLRFVQVYERAEGKTPVAS